MEEVVRTLQLDVESTIDGAKEQGSMILIPLPNVRNIGGKSYLPIAPSDFEVLKSVRDRAKRGAAAVETVALPSGEVPTKRARPRPVVEPLERREGTLLAQLDQLQSGADSLKAFIRQGETHYQENLDAMLTAIAPLQKELEEVQAELAKHVRTGARQVSEVLREKQTVDDLRQQASRLRLIIDRGQATDEQKEVYRNVLFQIRLRQRKSSAQPKLKIKPAAAAAAPAVTEEVAPFPATAPPPTAEEIFGEQQILAARPTAQQERMQQQLLRREEARVRTAIQEEVPRYALLAPQQEEEEEFAIVGAIRTQASPAERQLLESLLARPQTARPSAPIAQFLPPTAGPATGQLYAPPVSTSASARTAITRGPPPARPIAAPTQAPFVSTAVTAQQASTVQRTPTTQIPVRPKPITVAELPATRQQQLAKNLPWPI